MPSARPVDRDAVQALALERRDVEACEPTIASPLGEASEVGHVTSGLTNRPPWVEPTPSTVGQP